MKSNHKDEIIRTDEETSYHIVDDDEVEKVVAEAEEEVRDEKADKSRDWERFGMRLAVSTTLHPFEYAKVLMQLGFEPMAAVPGRTLLGHRTLVLPNLFQYTGFIYRSDGIIGCFRGLAPKLIGSIVSFVIGERVVDYFGLTCYKEKCGGGSDSSSSSGTICNDDELMPQFITNLKRDMVLTTTGIIVSHPFHVISIRMMSQFVGNETFYNSILASFFEIYKNDGWKGFFAGLMPKLICDVSCVILTSSAIYLLNKYLVKSETGRQYNTGVTQFIFSNLFYPLQVVSTCMIVSGTRLAIGKPPRMNEYQNWIDCWRDLHTSGQLKRGSSLFMRCAHVSRNFPSRN